MNILFKDDADGKLKECLDEFNKLPVDTRVLMDQYELAEVTSINDYSRWMDFLKNTNVMDQLNAEVSLFNQAQQRKLIAVSTEQTKSTGTAQLIGALAKITGQTDERNAGKMFVYCYVPLNKKEEKIPGTVVEQCDIFERSEE